MKSKYSCFSFEHGNGFYSSYKFDYIQRQTLPREDLSSKSASSTNIHKQLLKQLFISNIGWHLLCPLQWEQGEQEVLSLISFSTYFAYFVPALIHYANQKRTGEDIENTFISLEIADSY